MGVAPSVRGVQPSREPRPSTDDTARALTAELDLPLSAEAAGLARQEVAAVLRSWQLDDEDACYDAQLVLTELVTNAVRHGGRWVRLHLRLEAARLVLTVSDGSAVLPEVRDRAADESGRGMTIVSAVASEWGVRDREDGKAVWAALRLPRVPAQHATARPQSGAARVDEVGP